jgi:hypothetical protein
VVYSYPVGWHAASLRRGNIRLRGCFEHSLAFIELPWHLEGEQGSSIAHEIV